MSMLRGSVETKSGLIALALAAVLGLLAQDALADRPRHNASVPRHSSSPQQHWHHYVQSHRSHHFSAPRVVIAPVFVPRRYYYAPAPVYVAPPIIAAAPMVYPSTSSGYWYFCPDSQAYYPYVLECPSGWLAVVPGAPGPTN